MNLALRDHKIFQMKAELENRKKILCAKRHQLIENTKENHFLKGIANDYDNYNKHIISQREKQITFFQTLNQYIDGITNELQLTDSKLKDSKQEQREITKEIAYLKSELDGLVKSSNPDINSSSNIDRYE
jgi:septal ring factor EnvC (AmiA/AmiB activator)